MTTNPELVALVRKHLLPLFRKFGSHPQRRRWQDGEAAFYDPWWWPVDPASSPADWGLSEEMADEFWSLCEVPRSGRGFPGFQGSLGAKTGCIMILGERPSFSQSYAKAVTRLHKRITLVSQIPELKETVEETGFHVSDLIKIRGTNLRDGLTKEMLSLSLDCLNDELQTLQPAMVLATGMAVDAMRNTLNHFDIDETALSPLLSHSCLVAVPHWCASQPPQVWQDQVVSHLKACTTKHRRTSRAAGV